MSQEFSADYGIRLLQTVFSNKCDLYEKHNNKFVKGDETWEKGGAK